MKEILELLETDATLTAAEIADRLGLSEAEVEATLRKAKEDRVLMGRTAVVNWENTDTPRVYAFISVSASPEHGCGFDKVAEDISRFDEVHSTYLMSGNFDLQVVVQGEDFREIARFVAEKLAPIPGVRSTATAFVLKTYKLEGIPTQDRTDRRRLVVSP